jgi:hypothetical protein
MGKRKRADSLTTPPWTAAARWVRGAMTACVSSCAGTLLGAIEHILQSRRLDALVRRQPPTRLQRHEIVMDCSWTTAVR